MDFEQTVKLGRALRESEYRFVTVTPETHRRVVTRPGSTDPLRNLFGWNLPIERVAIPERIFELASSVCRVSSSGHLTSAVRFSTLGGEIFVHSSYPTEQEDAVFFGPDTYRFVNFVGRKIQRVSRVVDIGCGSGAGGICLAKKYGVDALYLTDISSKALEFAKINAQIAGQPATLVESDLFAQVPSGIDTIIANPPFILDSSERLYRHGGDGYGSGLSVRIVSESLKYLGKEGQLALYTGSAIVDGEDVFLNRILPLLQGFNFSYEEIDPDIFGEELSGEMYCGVERIAAVGLFVRK